ncbi:FAD binding domain-containing protein [Albimonas sp. CAU 1670]|uniref:FAD binding domain-containing protein n=1 Tax=Albimonas sp. CAU 1670 TaxID=3032599 RepID=UPI0023D98297|nr:FAD binding domain-containing protein [Albimonas sp. CAU 1670]MDF2230981.1 FAD binding domain-containing protein [Albimonas sp. CAU 1670]
MPPAPAAAAPRSLLIPATIPAALEAQAAGARLLAGGTWLMRAPLRGEALSGDFAALHAIEELQRLDLSPQGAEIGAAVSHARLAQALDGLPDLAPLAVAAGASANPGVRRAATLGGNLCAVDFPAADLACALLALEADVDLERLSGPGRLPLARFLETRAEALPGALVAGVRIPRRPGRLGAHVRLPLKRAGDYPVAILSLTADLVDGRLARPVVAVGSVEAAPRRWPELEAALEGAAPDPAAGATAAAGLLGGFAPRDGVEAPGWYRVEVLPALVRRALGALIQEIRP